MGQSRGTNVDYCKLWGTIEDHCHSRSTIVDHCQSRGNIVDHVGQSRGTIMDVTILRLPNMQVNHQLMEEKRISVS